MCQKKWSVCVFFLCLVTSFLWADMSFYIKQEKVSLPGQSIEIRVKGSLDSATITVFRIKNPEEFLKKQENIHKLVIENTPIRDELNRAIELSDKPDKAKVYGNIAPLPAEKLNFEYIQTYPPTKISSMIFTEEQNTDEHSPISLKIKEPGLYLVEFSQREEIAYCLALCSDLAMIVRRSEGKTLVYALDRKTGKPRPEARIAVYRQGNLLAQGNTDTQGIWETKTPYFPKLTIMASQGANFTTGDPEFFPSLVASYKAYIFTERPMYLPGETVYFKGIIRQWIQGDYRIPEIAKDTISYKITDAQNNVVQQTSTTLNKEACFAGEFALPQECTLGKFTLQAQLGNASFETEFKVEKFEKPKLLVNVKPNKSAVVMGEKVSFDISAIYYAGGNVDSGNVRYQLYRSRFDQPLFKDVGLEGFYSQGEYRSFKPELVQTGEMALKEGKCTVEFDTPTAGFSYYYNLQAVVTDPSRNVAEGSGSVQISQAEIKMDLKTNKEVYNVEDQILIQVRAVDLAENPVSVNFSVELIRKGRQYPKGGSAASIPWSVEREPETPPKSLGILKGKTSGDPKEGEGMGTVQMPALEPGEIEIHLTALDSKNNKITVEKAVWVGKGNEPVMYSGDSIRMIADKKAYKVGEKAQILLVLPMKNVSPLITLESSDILEYKVQHLPNNSLLMSVPITEAMSPNVYLRASAIYMNGMVESEHLLVVPPVHKMIRLEITDEKKPVSLATLQYGPAETVKWNVKATDQEGNPIDTDLALGVVDNSLYALASDQNAPLHQFFYPLRRPNVGSDSSIFFISYDYAHKSERLPRPKPPKVEYDGKEKAEEADMEAPREARPEARPAPASEAPSGAEPQRAESRRSMALADRENSISEKKKEKPESAEKNSPTSERKLFKTTAAWFAFVRTNEKGEGQVTFSFPEDLTDWKITARAIDARTHVGEIRLQTSTRKPVTVMIVRPSFLVEKDEVQCELSARNATSTAQELKLGMETSENVKVPKDATLTQTIDSGQWIRNSVRITAEKAGETSILAKVDGEYNDSLRQTMPVLVHGIRKSTGRSGILNQETIKIPGSSLNLPENAYTDKARVTVRLYPGYICAIQDSLQSLISYPYGCTEQTMSRFMPNLVAARVFQNLGMKSAANKDLDKFVNVGLQRLAQLQNKDGGWGWWNDGSHVLMSAYVMSGLGRAKDLGYSVHDQMRNKGLNFLKKIVSNRQLSYGEKAYALYALMLNKEPNTVETDKLFDQEARTKEDAYTLAMLGLNLHKLGRKAEAQIVVKEITQKASIAGDGYVYWGKNDTWRWDGNSVEVTAMVLRALATIQPKHEMITPALQWLMSQRKDDGCWHSTKDTSEAVLTLCTYLESVKQTQSATNSVTVSLNQALQKVRVENSVVTCTFPASAIKKGPNDLAILCEKPGELFYSAYLEYFSAEIPIQPATTGLSVTRSYTILREDKKKAGANEKIVYIPESLPQEIPSGATVMVNLVVQVPQTYDFVMVSDGLPATAMVMRDDRSVEVADNVQTARWTHREFHYDKAVFFFTRLNAGTYHIRYFFRPVLAGRFHALPAIASLMYYPEIQGNSEEKIFLVK